MYKGLNNSSIYGSYDPFIDGFSINHPASSGYPELIVETG